MFQKIIWLPPQRTKQILGALFKQKKKRIKNDMMVVVVWNIYIPIGVSSDW